MCFCRARGLAWFAAIRKICCRSLTTIGGGAIGKPFPCRCRCPSALSGTHETAIEAFLWGLLPDNEVVLGRWARRFQVSPRNAFSLIANVGEDCAGAVQFVRPERLEEIAEESFQVEWLDEAQIAQRLKTLRQDHAAWRMPTDVGQFSLAGAQPKTALLLLDGKWGVPAGRTATTHILKPPIAEFDGHAENEHFCLALGRELGLPTAASRVLRFGDETAIVVERYDRAYRPPEPSGRDRSQPILRLHQEDICQALGLFPSAKYQNEGGPSPLDVAGVLRTHSNAPTEDLETFQSALAFNWLIGGTDAHAKNYSVLHGQRSQVRLAPLYDLASALPYDALDPQKLKLAMKVGGTYRLRDIGQRQWRKLAEEVGTNADRLLLLVVAMAEAMPDAVARTRAQAKADGLTHPIVDRLSERLIERARACLRVLRL